MEDQKHYQPRADTESRVTRLETQMSEVRESLTQLKAQLSQTATKSDLMEMKGYFECRDKDHTAQLWWLVKGLIIIFGAVVLTAFGMDKIPGLFS